MLPPAVCERPVVLDPSQHFLSSAFLVFAFSQKGILNIKKGTEGTGLMRRGSE